MPCNCDYMEPNDREINHAKIIALIEELDTGILPNNPIQSRIYNKTNSEIFNKDGSTLCSRLKNTDVSKYSLEMQIWWRDHQKADELRKEADKLKKENEDK